MPPAGSRIRYLLTVRKQCWTLLIVPSSNVYFERASRKSFLDFVHLFVINCARLFTIYLYLKNTLQCFNIYNFNYFDCIYFYFIFYNRRSRRSFLPQPFILKGLPGCPVCRHGYLDSDAGRTIPHLAAPFSDTYTGDTTEAVPADEDNDYSVKILKEAGLKIRLGESFLIFDSRLSFQRLSQRGVVVAKTSLIQFMLLNLSICYIFFTNSGVFFNVTELKSTAFKVTYCENKSRHCESFSVCIINPAVWC